MARNRQGALGLKKLLQIGAGLVYLGIFIALFRKYGGEACELFLFGSSAVVILIGCLLSRRKPSHELHLSVPAKDEK